MKITTFWTLITILLRLRLIFGNLHRATKHPPVFLPTSIDFEEITKCSGFIDKTLFIEAFFNFKSPYNIFTRPRKFGKSTNMNMLKRFVQLEVDHEGKPKIKSETCAYQLFTNQTLKLRISTYVNTINDHLAKYAVIHIEFKGIMKNTLKETMKNLRQRVRNACLPYEWMIEIFRKRYQTTNDSNIGRQVRFLEKMIYDHDTINLDILMKSLSLLAKVLLNYFRRPIFVFIDDYDEAMDYGLRYAHQIEYDFTKVKYVTDVMMQNLFDEPQQHIKYIMITGLALGLPSMFSKYQIYLEHHQFLHSFEMATFFGFTDDQVVDLLTRHGIDQNEKSKLAEYYNGYLNLQWNITLYNPFGILSYLADFEQGNITYPLNWIDPGSLDFILEALKNPQIYASWLQLLVPKTGYFMVQSYTSEKRLIKLAARIRDNVPLGAYKVVAFFWYSMENGYITKTKSWGKQRLPNKEIEIEYTKILLRFYHLHFANITRPLSHTMKKLIRYRNVESEISNLKRQLEILMNAELKFEDYEELHYYSLVFYSVKKHFNLVTAYIRRRRMDTVYYIVANETETLTIIAVKYKNTLKEALRHASVYKTDDFFTEGKIIRHIGIRFDIRKKIVHVAYFSPNDQQIALLTAESNEEESRESSHNDGIGEDEMTRRRHPKFLYSELYEDYDDDDDNDADTFEN